MSDLKTRVEDFPPPFHAIRQDWLDASREEALEPDLPIVDPHHHLWDRKHERYLDDELLADIGEGHNVLATVFIQCRSQYRPDGPEHLKTLGEVEFAERVGAKHAEGPGPKLCAGIVSLGDFALGAQVGEVMAAQKEASPRFRGVRDMLSYDPDVTSSFGKKLPGKMRDPQWREGFAQLDKHGLSADIYVFHTQLDDVLDVARAFPETPIVLNHVGGPLGIGPYKGKRDDVFRDWSASIDALAACPNVVVKLGGMAISAYGFPWEELPQGPTSRQVADDIRPWIEHCIDRFGPQRGMFESNFPVDKGKAGYGVTWNAFKRITEGASADEKKALYAGTANRVYRLGLDI